MEIRIRQDDKVGEQSTRQPDLIIDVPLRDFFAGCALVRQNLNADYTIRAKWAYDQADAMLAAREEKGDA